MLVRSHQLARLAEQRDDAAKQPEGAAERAAVEGPVVVRAKMEYHSIDDAQGELIPDAELARLWLASQLVPGASVWVRI